MTETVSEAEVRAVRWVEHILAPLIVAAILTLATCANQTQDAIAQLENKTKTLGDSNREAWNEVKTIKLRQEQLLINVQKIDTNQENIKEDLGDMKAQNTEILRILREDNNHHNSIRQ